MSEQTPLLSQRSPEGVPEGAGTRAAPGRAASAQITGGLDYDFEEDDLEAGSDDENPEHAQHMWPKTGPNSTGSSFVERAAQTVTDFVLGERSRTPIAGTSSTPPQHSTQLTRDTDEDDRRDDGDAGAKKKKKKSKRKERDVDDIEAYPYDTIESARKPVKGDDLKTHMANERTFFKWLFTGFHIGAMGTFILSFYSDDSGRPGTGKILLCLAIWMVALVYVMYGLINFYRRRRALRQGLGKEEWDSGAGPAYVVAGLVLVIGSVLVYSLVTGQAPRRWQQAQT
jgi:uncharacterized membrane protein YidH (DUF202 family)